MGYLRDGENNLRSNTSNKILFTVALFDQKYF